MRCYSINTLLLCAVFLWGGFGFPAEARADDPVAEVYGTIVSIRGGILVIRPSLRPKLTRVSVSDQSQIIGFERVGKSFLKPGMRIAMRGNYSQKNGYRLRFIEAAEKPIGALAEHASGLEIEGGWANARGNLKSIEPFVFTDDDGKEFTAKTDTIRGVWRDYLGKREGLLIGVRVRITGHLSPDGVIRADVVSPDRDFSRVGTMFGEIVAVRGTGKNKVLTVRPRYTTDTIQVKCTANCIFQKQNTLDENTIQIGDTVTFWGQRKNDPSSQTAPTDLKAIALLVGSGRYPTAEGADAGVTITGKLTSLDPVTVTLPDNQQVRIVVPAQMVIARLLRLAPSNLKAGAPVMLVLKRNSDESFETSTVIVDASPWVGYGG